MRAPSVYGLVPVLDFKTVETVLVRFKRHFTYTVGETVSTSQMSSARNLSTNPRYSICGIEIEYFLALFDCAIICKHFKVIVIIELAICSR